MDFAKEFKKSLENLPIENRSNFFLNILETLPSMVFIKEAQDLRFVYWNPAGEKLLGYDKKDLIGKNDYDFFPQEEANFFIQSDRDVLESRQSKFIESEHIHTKDEKKVLRTRKIPLFDDNGKPVFLMGISEDITDQYYTNEKLKKTTEELEKLNAELESEINKRTKHLLQKTEDLEHFTHLAAHDLKEPLRKLQNLIDLLCLDLGEENKNKVGNLVAMIQSSTLRVKSIIDDFGILSKVTANTKEPKQVNLKSLVQDIIDQQKWSELKQAEYKFEGDFPETSQCYPNLISIHYSNLIENAIKHSKFDPVMITFTCEKNHDLQQYVYGVKNDNSKIEKKDFENIFKMFKRLSGDSIGSGIGLSICKKVIEHHKGSIWVDSDNDNVHFQFTLSEGREV